MEPKVLLKTMIFGDFILGLSFQYRAVGRFENPGVPVLFGGHNRSPMVEIGLTDLPKSGGVMAPPGGTPRDDTPGNSCPTAF